MPPRSTLEALIRDIVSKIPLDMSKFTVSVKYVEWSVATLVEYYNKGVIKISPELQRAYVWDDVKASRFIESLYLRFPVPPVMLLKFDENLYYVIDGVQRITSVIRYVNNQYALDTLIASKLRNKKFRDLPEKDKNILLTAPFPVQIVEIKGDETVKTLVAIEIFRRINLGAMRLNFTQLLFCSVPTEAVRLLRKLAGSEPFRQLFSFTEREIKQFKHYYLALILTLAFRRGEPLNMAPGYRDRYRADIRDLILTADIEGVSKTVSEVEATCKLALECGFRREHFVPTTYNIYRRAKRNVISSIIAQVVLLALRSVARPVVEDGRVVALKLPEGVRKDAIVNVIVDTIRNYTADGKDIREVYRAITHDGRTSYLRDLYRKVEDAVKLAVTGGRR